MIPDLSLLVVPIILMKFQTNLKVTFPVRDPVLNCSSVFNKELTAYTLLPSMETGVHSHAVAVLNNFLYVLGGQNHFEERGKTAVATVAR